MTEVISAKPAVLRLPLTDHLLLYLLEDEAVLFSERSFRLFGLDGPTTATLLRLAAGETVESLTAAPGSPVAAIEELAALLAGHEPPAEEYCPEKFCPDEVPENEAAPPPLYQLLTTCFTINCPDETLRHSLCDTLQHLQIIGQPKVDLAISIYPDGALWRLCFNGEQQGNTMPAAMLLPMLYGRLRIFAYQRFPYLLAIHAAVLSNGQNTILFPGQSGSGKSTLAAALLARGYWLFSDEVALLDENSEIVPIPLGLGLKSGSWSLLEADYPTLPTTKEQLRWDGNRLRYLQPGTIRFAENSSGMQGTHLCIPRFQPKGSGSIEPLSAVQALRSLTDAGYQVRGLTKDSVERMIHWLLGPSCFVMSYSSTEEALQLLDGVLGNRHPLLSKDSDLYAA